MRIAQIAPLVESVPPKKYGGTERVVYTLTEELVRRGHDVTLFATGDSKTSAKLVSVYPHSLRETQVRNIYALNTWTLLNLGTAYQRQKEFDVIHDHLGFVGMPLANIATTPVVVTHHGPYGREIRPIFRNFIKPHLVGISKSQVSKLTDGNVVGVVYNGLVMENYPFSDTPGDYLLYVGRISAKKGVHYAVQTAQILEKPLIIAAKLDEIDRPYFTEYIEPWLSEDIQWIGEVTEEERNQLMSKALCFLHPALWKEPFGLTLIEAMACGCPVVAFNRGSIPEVIVNGKTGFIVNTFNEMLDAVQKIDIIKRDACRLYALENFNAKKMADGYESIYKKVVKKKKKRRKSK